MISLSSWVFIIRDEAGPGGMVPRCHARWLAGHYYCGPSIGGRGFTAAGVRSARPQNPFLLSLPPGKGHLFKWGRKHIIKQRLDCLGSRCAFKVEGLEVSQEERVKLLWHHVCGAETSVLRALPSTLSQASTQCPRLTVRCCEPPVAAPSAEAASHCDTKGPRARGVFLEAESAESARSPKLQSRCPSLSSACWQQARAVLLQLGRKTSTISAFFCTWMQSKKLNNPFKHCLCSKSWDLSVRRKHTWRDQEMDWNIKSWLTCVSSAFPPASYPCGP